MSIGQPPGPWDPSDNSPANTPDTAETGWGLINDVDIAPWWPRLGAYLLDLVFASSIQTIVQTIHPLLQPWARGWLALGENYLISMLFLSGYMTLALLFTRNTLGKYIMGIQVVRDHIDKGYPSFGKILLRETVGRVLSLQFYLGYLVNLRDPKHQAWSDSMADTVVVRRPQTNTTWRYALTGVLLVVAIIAAPFAIRSFRQKQENDRLRAAITTTTAEMQRLAASVRQSGTQILSMNSARTDPVEIFPVASRLIGEIDRYETTVRKLQSLIRSALDRKLIQPDDVAKMQALVAACDQELTRTAFARTSFQKLMALQPKPASPGAPTAAATGQNVKDGRDLSYRVIADSTGQMPVPGPAFVVTSPLVDWTRLPGASWIGPSADQSIATRQKCCKNTSDTYQTSFNVPPERLAAMALDVAVVADTYVEVRLNGKLALFGPKKSMYTSPAKFLLRDGFVAGTNTLTFRVTDLGGATGLAVLVTPMEK